MDRSYISKVIEKQGESVKVQGWVRSIRDHGQLLFIDLRDSTGVLQIVADPAKKEAFEVAKNLGDEYVIEAEGKVVERAKELVNEKIPTGSIEVEADSLKILNKSKSLPFPIDDDGRNIDEKLRLQYRYIDLRRERLQKIIKQRADLMLAVRNWMNKEGFTEVTTPLLTSSSPEGARDFVVPSRLYPGKFFVLPQAPQQYKQLLMVGGLDRYFQIAPCARDEDPRADRHAGIFYQIDIEMSFPTIDMIFDVCERMIKETYEVVAPHKKIKEFPFPRIPHAEAMERFGSDKPDIRFGFELKTITDIVKGKTEFNIFNNAPVVKCVNAEGCGEWSRNEILEMETLAKGYGAKGLAYLKVTETGFETGIGKFMEPVAKELIEIMNAKPGDLLFFGAGEKGEINKYLAQVRIKIAESKGLRKEEELSFVWITDFPFYDLDDSGKLDFAHNPFSMPKKGIDAFDTDKPLEIESYQYDLALNGFEILSGSIRNHNPEILLKAFEKLGYDAEEVKRRFGALYNAFQYGAPPHGGWAVGIDRYLMILIDEPNIRDVYAFPMSSSGQELMMSAPSEIRQSQLDELHIQLKSIAIKGEDQIVQAIKNVLDSKGVKYEFMEHQEVKTSEEAAEIRGTKLSEGAKALILKKQATKHFIHAVVPGDKKINIEKLEEIVGSKLDMATASELEKEFGLQIGGVPPFGNLLGLKVYMDEGILDEERAVFNCGSKSKSIIMSSKDLVDVIEAELVKIAQ